MDYIYLVLLLVATCYAQKGEEETALNNICRVRNGYYRVNASCDSYVECIEYQATPKICPDGLHFDLRAKWPRYPCGYPHEVLCLNRGAVQPADPTEECPHQYGYFPSPYANPKDCGWYRVCVAGKSHDMRCPPGLGFNTDTNQCDWPESVPTCRPEDFLKFTCPPVPLNADGSRRDIVINYKSSRSCYQFYSCRGGRARLLSCDLGQAFDSWLGHCVDATLVKCGSDNSSGSDNFNGIVNSNG